MHWLGNISFSSAASSPTTHKQQHRARLTPRLTRLKNLKYMSEDEIATALRAYYQSQSDSSVPLPLPHCPRKDEQEEEEERDRPLPKPRVRVGTRYNNNKASGESSSSSSSKGCFSAHHQVGRKKFAAEHIDTRSTISSSQESKIVENENPKDNKFWLDVPARSPMLSPPRLSIDLYPHYNYNNNVSPKGNQIWSAPEIPTGCGLPSPTFPEYSHKRYSTDSCSPLQSPHVNRGGIGVPISTLLYPPRSYFDTDTTIGIGRRETTTTTSPVHPLPRPPTPSKPEPLRLNSHWQKGKLIGRGTFGSVYVASNRETGALCAMKEVELFPDDPKSTECMKQMEQEIKVLSQLKHPNIVQYYGSEIVEDRFYIYLEYVHPGSINKYVRDHVGAITESVVRNFTRHILSGLAYLHSKKTVHRDIKGANLLVDASGVVKVADFGMAKHLSGQAADLSLKGSPYWMAPELMQAVMQKDNSSDLAFAVDIWSLGCTIIEMLTGRPPWSEYEGAAAMFKVLRETPPIPETLSTEGKEFLQCCFQRNPADRPSATTLLEHPFLRNSQQVDVPSCCQALTGMTLMEAHQSPRDLSRHSMDQLQHSGSQALTGMKLMEAHQSPRDLSRHSVDQLLHSGDQSLHPTDLLPGVQMTKSKTSDSEDVWQSHEASDLTISSHYSLRSILETVPSLSPIHLRCETSCLSPVIIGGKSGKCSMRRRQTLR